MIHMASKSNNATKLTLKVHAGQDANGKDLFRQRTFNRMNPGLTDDDVYAIGTGLAGLQTHELVSIARTDNATITAE